MKVRVKIFVMAMILAAGLMFKATEAESATLLGDWLAENDIEASVEASVDFYDKYIWRGQTLDRDNVIQPAVTLAIGPFDGGFWGSWDIENEDGLASDEVDGWFGFNFDLGFISEELGIVGVSVGNTWYTFPEGNTHTEELYLTVAVDTFLSPYFTWFHDYGDEPSGADGDYFHFGGSHSFTLIEEYGITLDLGYELGLNNEAFITGDGGYNLLSAGVTIPLTETVTMTPNIAFSSPFGDLSDPNDGNHNDEIYGGVSFAFAN